MSDIISQTSLPSDGERVALRTTLIERRHRLTALPPDAVGPQVAGLLTEIDAALDRLEGAGSGHVHAATAGWRPTACSPTR